MAGISNFAIILPTVGASRDGVNGFFDWWIVKHLKGPLAALPGRQSDPRMNWERCKVGVGGGNCSGAFCPEQPSDGNNMVSPGNRLQKRQRP